MALQPNSDYSPPDTLFCPTYFLTHPTHTELMAEDGQTRQHCVGFIPSPALPQRGAGPSHATRPLNSSDTSTDMSECQCQKCSSHQKRDCYCHPFLRKRTTFRAPDSQPEPQAGLQDTPTMSLGNRPAPRALHQPLTHPVSMDGNW